MCSHGCRWRGPASRSSTRWLPDAVSRLASTQPALPAPTMMKSNASELGTATPPARRLKTIRRRRPRQVASHLLAHILIGEPGPTSPGYALLLPILRRPGQRHKRGLARHRPAIAADLAVVAHEARNVAMDQAGGGEPPEVARKGERRPVAQVADQHLGGEIGAELAIRS